MREAGAEEVVVTLADAVVALIGLAPPLAEPMIPTPVAAHEEGIVA